MLECLPATDCFVAGTTFSQFIHATRSQYKQFTEVLAVHFILLKTLKFMQISEISSGSRRLVTDSVILMGVSIGTALLTSLSLVLLGFLFV